MNTVSYMCILPSGVDMVVSPLLCVCGRKERGREGGREGGRVVGREGGWKGMQGGGRESE